MALLVLTACGNGGGPTPTTGAEAVADVRAAYLDAWAVRDAAVHSGDASMLNRRFSDGDPAELVGNLQPGAPSALEIVSESVTARVAANLDVAGEIEHRIESVDVADDGDAAQVVDRVTDHTYLVDRMTKVERSSREATTYTETWFLVRRDGAWKVIYFARSSAG